jgi:hypothetical protein
MRVMAMGTRAGEQEDLFVTHQQLRAASHPYYQAVNRIFAEKGFDGYAQEVCAEFYAKEMGRPYLLAAPRPDWGLLTRECGPFAKEQRDHEERGESGSRGAGGYGAGARAAVLAGIRKMVGGAAAGLRGRGQSWMSIGRALDLPAETARRLCLAAEDGKVRGGFVRVSVADAGSGKGERSGLLLVSPSGHRVEGLDAEQAAPLDSVVDGLQVIDFSPPCHPATRLLALASPGLSPAERASLR